MSRINRIFVFGSVFLLFASSLFSYISLPPIYKVNAINASGLIVYFSVLAYLYISFEVLSYLHYLFIKRIKSVKEIEIDSSEALKIIKFINYFMFLAACVFVYFFSVNPDVRHGDAISKLFYIAISILLLFQKILIIKTIKWGDNLFFIFFGMLNIVVFIISPNKSSLFSFAILGVLFIDKQYQFEQESWKKNKILITKFLVALCTGLFVFSLIEPKYFAWVVHRFSIQENMLYRYLQQPFGIYENVDTFYFVNKIFHATQHAGETVDRALSLYAFGYENGGLSAGMLWASIIVGGVYFSPVVYYSLCKLTYNVVKDQKLSLIFLIFALYELRPVYSQFEEVFIFLSPSSLFLALAISCMFFKVR